MRRKREAESGQSDRKLLEDLKQGSWEVIGSNLYFKKKSLAALWRIDCRRSDIEAGDHGGDSGRSPMTDAGSQAEGFSSKATAGPHSAFVTIRKSLPFPLVVLNSRWVMYGV